MKTLIIVLLLLFQYECSNNRDLECNDKIEQINNYIDIEIDFSWVDKVSLKTLKFQQKKIDSLEALRLELLKNPCEFELDDM